MVGKASILYVAGFGIVLGMIGWNMSRYSVQSTGNMEAFADGTLSHNLALAGINIAMTKFYNNHAWGGDITQDFNLPGLKGTATVTMSSYGTVGQMTSTSSYAAWWASGGLIHDTIRVFFDVTDTNSFAKYAWLTGFNGNDQFWYGGDTVWGPVRSSGGLHMGPGAEVFDGKVTLAKNITGPGKPVYLQGPPVKSVGVPMPWSIAEISTAATSGGKVYTGNVNVSFIPGTAADNDGSIVVRNATTSALVDSFWLGTGGFNGAVWVNGDVHVLGGKVDGKLSIGSSNNIYIQGGGVRYEQDPLLGTSADVLGLIATNNITIGLNASAPDPANWPKCRIDAGLFALKGGFSANTPGGTGVLTVTGAIVEGSKGDVMGSNGKDGFLKRYHWDKRFADPNFRPPYFPSFGPKTFKITNWWESPRHRPLNL